MVTEPALPDPALPALLPALLPATPTEPPSGDVSVPPVVWVPPPPPLEVPDPEPEPEPTPLEGTPLSSSPRTGG